MAFCHFHLPIVSPSSLELSAPEETEWGRKGFLAEVWALVLPKLQGTRTEVAGCGCGWSGQKISYTEQIVNGLSK